MVHPPGWMLLPTPLATVLWCSVGREREWMLVQAGLSAGAVASVLVTPVDQMMIRQYVESGRVSATTGLFTSGLYKGKKPTFSGSTDLFWQIWRARGVRGLFQGWQYVLACVLAPRPISSASVRDASGCWPRPSVVSCSATCPHECSRCLQCFTHHIHT
jgi:hypothetical protein